MDEIDAGGTTTETNNRVDSVPPASGEKQVDAIKLFVGQIPKSVTETELRAEFEPFGPIHELTILHDRLTNEHKGCAFVTFCSREDALEAQKELNDKRTLVGMNRPMQIRLTEQEAKAEERKLFVGMLPKTHVEEDVRKMFVDFGEIEEVNVLKDQSKCSRGCAFVKMSTRQECEKAIEALNGKTILPGASSYMVVRYADSEKERTQRRLQKALQIQQQQQQQQQAMAAMVLSPTGPHFFQNGYMGGPAVGMYGPGPSPSPGAATPTSPATAFSFYDPYMAVQPPYGPGYPMYGGGQQNGFHTPIQPQPEGPEGANLFIYHLPQDIRDHHLVEWFGGFGNIVSTKVYIDRATNQSKCFGFVSFDNARSAEAAIAAMNGKPVGKKRLKVQHKRLKAKIDGNGEMEENATSGGNTPPTPPTPQY